MRPDVTAGMGRQGGSALVCHSAGIFRCKRILGIHRDPLRSAYVDVATSYNDGISQRVFYRESTDITCFNLDTFLNDVLTEAAKTNATFLDISIPDWLVAYPASALQNET